MTVSEMLVDQLESARRMTLETFNDLNTGQRLFQPAPDVNHPLWLLGHITGSEDHLILGFCKGESLLPEAYGKLFAMGSTLLEDPSGYPAGEEILEHMARVHEAALEYVRGASDDELEQPPVGFDRLDGRARDLFATRGRCVWFHAQHEAMHAGQMGYIRRLLGKPPRV